MLKKDDWILTQREFRSQRVQLQLQLECNTAVLNMIEKRIKGFPDGKNQKDDKHKQIF